MIRYSSLTVFPKCALGRFLYLWLWVACVLDFALSLAVEHPPPPFVDCLGGDLEQVHLYANLTVGTTETRITLRLKFNGLNLLNKSLAEGDTGRGSYLQNSSELSRILDILIRILQWYKRLSDF